MQWPLKHQSIACPRVPTPWEMVGIWPGWGQMYPKSPPGDRRNGQTAPPCTRGEHSADWCRSMCPTPVTHLVVKFSAPGKAKRSNPPWSPGGGGGGALQLIGALRQTHVCLYMRASTYVCIYICAHVCIYICVHCFPRNYWWQLSITHMPTCDPSTHTHTQNNTRREETQLYMWWISTHIGAHAKKKLPKVWEKEMQKECRLQDQQSSIHLRVKYIELLIILSQRLSLCCIYAITSWGPRGMIMVTSHRNKPAHFLL